MDLADAAAQFANDATLQPIEAAAPPGSCPILKSKGAGGQTSIQSQPDEEWIPKRRDESIRQANGGTHPEADKILAKAGHLLITADQDNSAGCLTATANDAKICQQRLDASCRACLRWKPRH